MNMEIQGKKLISNTFYFFLDFVVGTLLGLIFWYMAGKTLVPADLGKLSTSLNLAYVLSAVSLLGMNYAVWKLIPEYIETKKEKKVISLVRFSLEVTLITNLIILAVFFAFPDYLSTVLKVDISSIQITGLIVFFLSFSWQFGFILWGLQDIKKLFLTDFMSQIPRILIPAVLIFLNIRLIGLFLGFLAGVSVATISRIFSTQFIGAGEKINKREVFFSYGIPAAISTAASIFFLNGQYVLLTILKNTEITGRFTIAMTLTSFLYLIPNVLTSALLPISSQLSVKQKQKENLARFIELIFRYSLFFTLPIAIFFLFFPEQIILVFSRTEYLSASPLFPLLSFSSLIYGLGYNFLQNLYAVGKPKLNRNIYIFTSILFLFLSIPLISAFSDQGLALSYLLSSSFLFVSSYYSIRKFLKVKIPLGNIIKLIPALFFMFLFIYLTKFYFSGLFYSIVFSLLSLVIYSLMLIPFRFYIKEDWMVLNFLSNKSPIFRNQFKRIFEFLKRFVK